jgi:hypothetical protein
VVKLIHTSSNSRFDIVVVFMANYFFMGGDNSVDSESFFVTDFVNLKIKPTQSFRGVHRVRMCIRVFI